MNDGRHRAAGREPGPGGLHPAAEARHGDDRRAVAVSALARGQEDIAALPLQERGQLVTRALEESKSWLAVATRGTDPAPIAEFKAWAATVAEMTRQKGLAREIQLDAVEMVRRAERGIGVATRHGQAVGVISGHGGDRRASNGAPRTLGSPAELLPNSHERADVYAMTDGVTDEAFEDALAAAREEHNLARANVVRKLTPPPPGAPTSRAERAARIGELAAAGYSSRQIAGELGVAAATVRRTAREDQIDLPADRVTAGTRHIDPHRVIEQTITTLSGVEYALGLLSAADLAALPASQTRTWLAALDRPVKAIHQLIKELNSHA